MTGKVQKSPETVALADWLVGPFSHTEDIPTGDLEAWQVPFYDVAIGGLRQIAGINQEQDLPDNFQPDPVKSVALYRELSYDRKVHGMINNLFTYIDDYKSGALETKLRPHQQDIMDVLAEEIANVGMDRQINIKSPTGTGKTAILTTLIEAMKYKEQPHDSVRALVLLPTKDILSQTIKAFRKFTNIEAAMYFGESKEIGEVTGMSYQSFANALQRGDIDRNSFDVVVRDEADTFSRGKTGELVDDYCKDTTGRNKLVIGLTATPHEKQKLSYERTLLESIGDKLLAPLSTYQRHTNAVVHEGSDRDWREDFNGKEVGHLMEDESRNNIVVEEVVSGLQSGRRVLVRCIPGQELRHPEIIRQMLQDKGKVHIRHPYVGDSQRRSIRAVVVPGSMDMKSRGILTSIFNNELDDRIDVLLFVGTLIRGFDSPVAKKVINAAPTRSPVLVEQLLGRVERWFETSTGNIMDAKAVDIVDNTDSGQVTFADIINRDAPEGMRYKPNSIIGPQLADLAERGSKDGSAFVPIAVEELVEAIDVLSENGLSQLGGIDLMAVGPESLKGRDAERTVSVAALLKTAKYISPRQIQTGSRVELKEAANELGVTPEDLMMTAHRLRVGIEVLDHGARVSHYFSNKALQRLKDRLSR